MKIFIKKLGYCSALIASAYLYSQYDGHVGVNTETPKATLDVSVLTSNLSNTSNEGIIAPKLSKNRIAKIAAPVEGTLVYATDDSNDLISSYTGSDSKVAKITEKGYYYFDGTEWVRAGGVIANSSGSATNFNIYNKSDKLTGNRIVTLDGHTLNFKGNKSVTLEPNFGLNIAGQLRVTETNAGSNTDKILVVGTDGIVKTIDKNLDSFTINNGGSNTDTSIYTGDGTLSGFRTIHSDNYSLYLEGKERGGLVIGKNSVRNHKERLRVNLEKGSEWVVIDGLDSGSNSNDIVSVDGNGALHKIPISSIQSNGVDHNIYTKDDTLTGNRNVGLNGHNLGFSGNGNVGIGTASPSQKLDVVGKIKVSDTNGGTENDQILVIGSDNVIKKVNKTPKQLADTNTNLYTDNGTLAGNRTVTSNGHFLHLNVPSSNGGLVIGASNTKNNAELFRVNLKEGSEWFVVNGLNTGNANSDNIVSVDGNGAFHKIPVSSIKSNGVDHNIYTKNDNLTGDRTVNLSDHSINFVNTTRGKEVGLKVIPSSNIVELDAKVKVKTPETGGNTDKILVIGGDGIVKTIAKTANDINTDTTLYSTDGNLQGDRTIHSNNHTLYLDVPNSNGGLVIGSNSRGPAELFRVNLKEGREWFVVNGLNGGNASSDNIVSVDNNGAFHKIPVSSIKSNGVSHNIYTQNDKLTGDRIVTMDNHTLTFQGNKKIVLDKEGTITAESYRSSTFNSFPDYVFQKYYSGHSSLKADYTFKTLSQVEDYIKANGHLPGYQSAMEIKNQGFVDLTKTQLSNVEKIEELYLHTIEQDKELKNKDKKIQELEYRLEKLESLLSKFNK